MRLAARATPDSSFGNDFNLSKVFGGKFWYRADSLRTMVATKVSALGDKLGIQSALTQATDAKRPLVNAGDVAFGGHDTLDLTAGQWLSLASLASSLAKPFTVYYAGLASVDHSTFRVMWGDPNSASNANLVATITSGNVYIGAATTLSSSVAAGTPQIICTVVNGSTSAIYVNGRTAKNSGDAGNNGIAGLSLGIYSDLSSFPQNGKFAEIFCGTGAHDATMRSKIMRYMSKHYAVPLT